MYIINNIIYLIGKEYIVNFKKHKYKKYKYIININ